MPGFRPLVVLCLLLMSLSACSPEAPALSPSPSGGQSSPLAEATSVDATTRLDLPVGGTSQHPLLIRVQAGAFSGPGNIRSVPFTSDRPEWSGYTSTGSGLIVESETITQWSADGVASDIAAAALAGDRNRLLDSRAVPTDVWRSLVASAKGAESAYASAPFDGETTDGEFKRYVLSFGFASGESTTWEVRMASSGSRYGWRMVSATRQ